MYVLDCDKCVPDKYFKEAFLSANLYTAPYKHTPFPLWCIFRYTAQIRFVGVSVMPRLYVFDYTQLSACSNVRHYSYLYYTIPGGQC